jgi:hypothetical protein
LGKTCRTFETRIRKEANKKPLLTTHLLRYRRGGRIRRQHESRSKIEQVDKAVAEDEKKYILQRERDISSI